MSSWSCIWKQVPRVLYEPTELQRENVSRVLHELMELPMIDVPTLLCEPMEQHVKDVHTVLYGPMELQGKCAKGLVRAHIAVWAHAAARELVPKVLHGLMEVAYERCGYSAVWAHGAAEEIGAKGLVWAHGAAYERCGYSAVSSTLFGPFLEFHNIWLITCKIKIWLLRVGRGPLSF